MTPPSAAVLPPSPSKADLEQADARPVPLAVRPDAVPETLKARPQWVAWDYERRHGRWTKVPVNPHTGGRADVSDPRTWGTFAMALGCHERGGLAGVGYVFAADDPFAGVDLDDCRDPATGALAGWARADVAGLDSYAEVSPSGTGVKVFVAGRLPPGGRRRKPYELYDQSRFFTVTGARLPDAPADVRPRQAALERLHARIFGEADDDALLARAQAAANGAKFARLWAGDAAGYDSASEADLALCRLLAFWTGPDPARIDRLFRRSGLYRDKWDRDDYRRRTLATALDGRPLSPNPSPPSGEATVPRPAACPWPMPMDPAAYHGLAGALVRVLEPHSEADPAALLGQLLVGFGSLIGRGAHFTADGKQHFCNEFLLLVGPTASAAKGTSWKRVANVLAAVDPAWAEQRVRNGLATGEGLIWHVRDPITGPLKSVRNGAESYHEGVTDPGITDKRLLAIEEEFARVMSAAGRPGNTLSPLLRQAWDSGRLEGLTKGKPAACAAPHVSLIAHCTPVELSGCLSRTDCSNGFGNRFLLLCARRSKLLPDGGALEPPGLAPLVEELRAAADFARAAGELCRDGEARKLWHAEYPRLVEGPGGLAGALLARAAPHVMRLACLYALLDRSASVCATHLHAALAFWDYCRRSVLYVFGDALGDPVADAIEEALRQAPDGLSREQIRSDVFNRNRSSAVVARALHTLRGLGRAHPRQGPTGGRPEERWFHGPEPERGRR